MTPRIPRPRGSRGFTLVEAIMTIAIIGIIGGIVAVFIRTPILSYRDTVDRAELTDQADLALRRIARDIRLALPNSVRVSSGGDHLEFLQTRSGARYLAAEDGVAPTQILSFDDTTDTSFSALSPPASFDNVQVGDFVVVYNLGPGFSPGNAYDFDSTGDTAGNVGKSNNKAACPAASPVSAAGNIARICALNPSASDPLPRTVPDATLGLPARTITLAGNPFARQQTALASPLQRFQVVSGPVSFYCTAGSDGRLALWRAWNYPIASTQAIPAAGAARAMIASGLSSCNQIFSYGSAASQRTGLVRVALSLRGRTEDQTPIRLVHQIHVDNTP